MSRVSQTVNKFWPASIRGQLILGIALVHLLLMTIFVFDLVVRQRAFLKKQNHEQANNFVNDFAVNATPYIIANDFDQLERFTLYHTNFPNLKYAMVLSADGIVLAHTNTGYVGKKPTDDISQQLTKLTSSKTLIEDNHVLDIAVPILVDKKIVGWARAGIGQDYIQANLATIIEDGILYIIIALLVGTAFAILIGNRLTAGLYKLIATAGKIKEGDRAIRAAPFKTMELLHLGTAFNQMLDEISRNETLLSMVIENMPVGVWILNEKGEFVSGNSAGKQIWWGSQNMDIHEFKNYKGWRTDTNKLMEPEEWATSLALKKGETTINEEIEIEDFEGHRKFILNSAFPLKTKEGLIIGAIAINVDITERKKIMEQLSLSESTIRSAFDHSAIGVCLVLPDGKFLRVNRAVCHMIGYSETELLSKGFQDITHPDDLEEDLENVKRILEGKVDTYRMEKRYFHKNGSLIWIHLTVSLVRDGHNNPLFFVSQIEDITERKKSDLLLKESEEKFRKLVEESEVGVFILQDNRLVYVNPRFEKITGYSEASLLNNMSFEKLVHKEELEKAGKNHLSEFAQEKSSGHYQLKFVREDGTILQTEIFISPISLEGRPAVIGTIIDITKQVEEEKRISKAVTDAQENERQQISMELHDNVKQMMAACLLNIDYMKMVVKDEKTSVVISNIKNYMREAIDELRRISHQLAPSVDATVSLEEKIRMVVSTMNVSQALEIHYHFGEMEDFITADVQLAMYRIVQEQFANIIKHSKASLVDIMVERRNGDICMSIEDNGIGFDPHKTKNGIGLENMRRRVQVFNGNFSIQASPGKGCKLYIELPADQFSAPRNQQHSFHKQDAN
jgi:PAS domain S-box-containing protein